MTRLRRITCLGATLLLSACLGVFVAPAAHAQIGLPNTDTVTDTLTDTTEEVTDTVTGTVGQVTEEVEETVDETVEDPGSLPDRVTDTVGDITEDVPDGPVTDPVKDLVNDAGNTVDEVTGGTGTPPLPGKNGGRDGSGNPQERRDGRGSAGRDRVLGGAGNGATGLGLVPPDGFIGAISLDGAEPAQAIEFETAGPSFGEQAGRIALEVAKRFAFPMLLLALVAMFLAFHGRVGRKDPKLALAAIDPEQNLLDFK